MDHKYEVNFQPHDHRLVPPREEFSLDDPEDEQEQQAGWCHPDEEYW